MRIPNWLHQSHPWVISRIAPDFTLLDAWALPVHGERDDFAAFVDTGSALDPARSASTATRALFALRLRMGRWFGWDDTENTTARPIPGCTETTLSARLPTNLRGSATSSAPGSAYGFTPIYRTDDEWAAEISNATVHGVLQLAWVEQPDGSYRGRMGIYVKPRGVLGVAYLRAIAPFRHLIVYPALLRQVGRAWEARASVAGAQT